MASSPAVNHNVSKAVVNMSDMNYTSPAIGASPQMPHRQGQSLLSAMSRMPSSSTQSSGAGTPVHQQNQRPKPQDARTVDISHGSGIVDSYLAQNAWNEPVPQSFVQRTSFRRRNRADSALYFGEASYKITDDAGNERRPSENLEHMKNIKQSRRIPYWIWFIIAKCLGIRIHEKDKPWFGTMVFMFTMTLSLLHAITMTWFTIQDIVTVWTSTTVITGSVQICIVLAYCSIGVYANQLAYRLFTNRMMLNSVRMHSKTIFKMNISGLMGMLGVVFIIINVYHNRDEFDGRTCNHVQLNPMICYLKFISRGAYSTIALFWNMMVAIVVLSVCRTHTIGIRRFIKELEEDGRLYCEYSRRIIHHGHSRVDDIMHNFESLDFDTNNEQDSWDELRYFDQSTQAPTSQNPSSSHTSPSHQTSPQHATDEQSTASSEILSQTDDTSNLPPVITIISDADMLSPKSETDQLSDTNHSLVNLVIPDPPSQISQGSSCDSRINSTKVELGSPRQAPSPETQEQFSIEDEELPQILTNEDILLSYWQINCRLRLTSNALQRWLASWVIFVTLWSALYIIWWLKNAPTFCGIAEFIIPLLMLPLLCSAYAEVNFEAKRMLTFICPVESRVQMLRFFIQQPLQMTVFGFTVNYGAIASVIMAIGIAFATRIVMDIVNA